MYFGTREVLTTPLTERLFHPVFYESVGRGVIFTDVRHSFDQKVVVMGIDPDILDFDLNNLRGQILQNAWDIATDAQSKYDYLSIPGFVILRLICEKLGIPLPLKYQRNGYMICSEAVAEPFWRASLNVVPLDIEPLPGDFVLKSKYLINKGTCLISECTFC
jgi:hypothetical protein